MKMVKVVIELDDDTIRKIDVLRKPLKMSRSKYVVMIIRKYIANESIKLRQRI